MTRFEKCLKRIKKEELYIYTILAPTIKTIV